MNTAYPIYENGLSQHPAAIRGRRMRKRRKDGVVAVVQVPITQAFVDELIASDWIKRDQADDREELTAAVRDLARMFAEKQVETA